MLDITQTWIEYPFNSYLNPELWLCHTICRPELQASLEPCSVAVHEFRIPPNALLGMHSYCPVHFDASHAVLVDISVHVSLLRTGSYIPPLKVPRFVMISLSDIVRIVSLNLELPAFICQLLSAWLPTIYYSATWAVEDNGQDFDGSDKVCNVTVIFLKLKPYLSLLECPCNFLFLYTFIWKENGKITHERCESIPFKRIQSKDKKIYKFNKWHWGDVMDMEISLLLRKFIYSRLLHLDSSLG